MVYVFCLCGKADEEYFINLIIKCLYGVLYLYLTIDNIIYVITIITAVSLSDY